MRILVIGGTGFIGRFLLPELVRAGHDVSVLTRGQHTGAVPDEVRRIVGDRGRLAERRTELAALAPDVVIDVVLSSGRQAQTLMDVFRGTAGRVVAISSMDVYRACGILHRLEAGPPEPVPLTEESALRTRLQTYPPEQIQMLKGVFGWLDDEYDKVPVERAVLGDAELPATVLRLPMIYGPGDPLHRLFPLIKRMDDLRPVIVLSEPVAQWRGPRGYVENVAAAIALGATSEPSRVIGSVFNVGERESFSELEWARRVAAVAGWSGEFVVVPDDVAPAHIRIPGNLEQHWSVDTTRIRSELGYAETVPIDEAIRRTIAWERANAPGADPRLFDYAAEDAALTAAR